MKAITKMQLIDTKGESNTPWHLTEKNTEEVSPWANVGEEQKVFRVHNSKNTPEKNRELVPPITSSEVSAFGINSRLSDDSPPNKLLPNQLKSRPNSTLDANSSQSLSLSNVTEFANNSKCGLNPRNSANHEDGRVPVEAEILGLERHNLDGEKLKLRRMKVTSSGVSMDQSTKGVISTQNKDRNSKQDLGSEQEDSADLEDKPTDFPKQILGRPGLYSPKKDSMGLDSIETVRTLEQTSLTYKKHGGICWCWRSDVTTEKNAGSSTILVILGLAKEA